MCICVLPRSLRLSFSNVIWVRKSPSLGFKTGRSIYSLIFNRERKTNLFQITSIKLCFQDRSVEKRKLSLYLKVKGVLMTAIPPSGIQVIGT